LLAYAIAVKRFPKFENLDAKSTITLDALLKWWREYSATPNPSVSEGKEFFLR
jgi:hypothetical protein